MSSSESQGGSLLLRVNGAARAHSFLITLERSVADSKAEFAVLGFKGAQRETGEIVIEGEGALELTARESGGIQRMDVKEAGALLRGMAHQSVQAAFRYHRRPGDAPALALAWTRFPDTALLAAVAQSATVTTLVTSEGRSLTEVKLSVRNREQPFLRVALPSGTSVVSADVGGEGVKPVHGVDGTRVPLLRAGFRPAGTYNVTFVIMHSGAPFAKKGGGQLALPKMDLPIGLVEWEVFLPQRYRVKDFAGDVIAAPHLSTVTPMSFDQPIDLQPGMLGGHIVDPTGMPVPHAKVIITHQGTRFATRATTDQNGRWVALGVPPGRVTIEADAPGFRKEIHSNVDHVAGEGTAVNFTLQVGSVSESVEVTASAPNSRGDSRQQQAQTQTQTQASFNVANLQRRVAGVLPIPIDVPKAGNSYRFVRPLVVDEETRVTFTYRASK